MAKKLTKAAKLKLIKAAELLHSSSAADTRALNNTKTDNVFGENYKIKNDGSVIKVSLVFKNPGVGAVTKGKITDVVTGTNKIVLPDLQDSFNDEAIGKDTDLFKKFLQIGSTIVATNVTPLPANFKAQLVLTGGVQKAAFDIEAGSFTQVGDKVQLDITIFFF